MNPSDLNLETVMSRRFELDEQIAIIQGKHKAELEPLNEEKHLCEQFIKEQMLTAGLQNLKTAAGHMTFFQTKDSVTMDDWDQFIAIVQQGNWHLLNHAANKTAVKEWIAANNAPPPGVRYDSFKDLAWRRGKG